MGPMEGAVKLCDGNSEMRVMEGPTLQRLTGETEKREDELVITPRRWGSTAQSPEQCGYILDDALPM